jgi:hypothetical protein
MSNSVHLSDMSRVPDQRCFRPFRNRQSAARSVLPNWQLPLTGRLVTTSRAHTRGEPPVPASVFVYVTATARGRVTHQPAVCFSVTLLR